MKKWAKEKRESVEVQQIALLNSQGSLVGVVQLAERRPVHWNAAS